MADQNQEPVNTEVNEPQEPQNQAPALTEIEQRANAQGWVPKDQWEGDPDQWRPAKEFLDRGELFKKIDDQNRTIKEFKKTLEEFGKHHARVAKVEYERALADLKAQKREALAEGDADALIDIDDKIAMTREAQRAAESTPQVNIPDVSVSNPVFDAWVERNGWYNANAAMRAYADKVGADLGARGGSPTDILAAVEREVKKEFAHKFTNPNREKPGAVEAGGTKGGKPKETFELSEVERKMMKRFVAAGAITEEKYIADLKAAKARGV